MKTYGVILVAVLLMTVPVTASAAVDLPRTGVTQSVTSGDDGDQRAGIPLPQPRFIINGDGTVTDNLTGLIWLRDANCPNDTITWANAHTFANSLANGDCGLIDNSEAGDWRLPNVKELMSLVNFNYYNPALSDTQGSGQWSDGYPFFNVQRLMGEFSGYYWTSTTEVDDTSTGTDETQNAHTVNIARGNTFTLNKVTPSDENVFVWPVKDCSSIGGGACN